MQLKEIIINNHKPLGHKKVVNTSRSQTSGSQTSWSQTPGHRRPLIPCRTNLKRNNIGYTIFISYPSCYHKKDPLNSRSKIPFLLIVYYFWGCLDFPIYNVSTYLILIFPRNSFYNVWLQNNSYNHCDDSPLPEPWRLLPVLPQGQHCPCSTCSISLL